MATKYGTRFYDRQSDGSYVSARQVVPIVAEILSPRSVVDVGCGTGAWLKAFQEIGVLDCLGIDGDYVARSRLRIAAESFVAMDLKNPAHLDRTFDLAMSLECAEHLEPAAAEGFVRFLTSLAPVVLFSAAAPGQGGRHHVNEQWPSYWVRLFSRFGFVAIDILRPRIWSIPDIQPWYCQNSLLYVAADKLPHFPALLAHSAAADGRMIDVVHPRFQGGEHRLPTRRLLQLLWNRAKRRMKRRRQ